MQPKRCRNDFLDHKRKTIGLRIPSNLITQKLLQLLGAPLLSVSFITPEQAFAVSTVYDLEEMLQNKVDLILDAGACLPEETTIVDLTGRAS